MFNSGSSVPVIVSDHCNPGMTILFKYIVDKGISTLTIIGDNSYYPWNIGFGKGWIRISGTDIGNFELQV